MNSEVRFSTSLANIQLLIFLIIRSYGAKILFLILKIYWYTYYIWTPLLNAFKIKLRKKWSKSWNDQSFTISQTNFDKNSITLLFTVVTYVILRQLGMFEVKISDEVIQFFFISPELRHVFCKNALNLMLKISMC